MVGAYWQRLPSLVSIATISVEKLTKTNCTRRCARRRILRSLVGLPEHLIQRVGPNFAAHYRNQCKFIVLLPKKTSLRAFCSLPESELTREEHCIFEHGDTERLYCVETSPSHLSTNQLLFPCTSTYVGLCGWFLSRSCVSSVSASHLSFSQVNLKNPKKYLKNLSPVTGSQYPDSGLTFWVSASIWKCCILFSTLKPLELISTLLGRAYSLCLLEVPPRRKQGKWEKVISTCWKPAETPSLNSLQLVHCCACDIWSVSSALPYWIIAFCYLKLWYPVYSNELDHFLELSAHLIGKLRLYCPGLFLLVSVGSPLLKKWAWELCTVD